MVGVCFVRIAVTQPPARLTTGCLLDLCGLARACFGLPPPLPRSFWREAGQPGYPRKRSQPDRAETGPLDRLLRPRAGWLGTRQAARESRKGGAGVQARGAGRCSRPQPGARSRPQAGRRQNRRTKPITVIHHRPRAAQAWPPARLQRCRHPDLPEHGIEF